MKNSEQRNSGLLNNVIQIGLNTIVKSLVKILHINISKALAMSGRICLPTLNLAYLLRKTSLLRAKLMQLILDVSKTI